MMNNTFKNGLWLGWKLGLGYLVGIYGIEMVLLGSAHLPASEQVLVIIKHKNVKILKSQNDKYFRMLAV